MIIVANGQPRSGSTLVYNITRLIALSKGRLGTTAGMNPPQVNQWIKDRREGKAADFDVIKCHYYIPHHGRLVDMRLLYTYRNPLDALASSTRVKGAVFEKMGYDLFIGGLHYDYSHYCAMAHVDTVGRLMIKYEDLQADVRRFIIHIADRMGIRLTTAGVHSIADELAVDRMKKLADSVEVDSTTQIRRGHIGPKLGAPNGWREQLPPWIIERVRTEFRHWLAESWPALLEY